MERETGKGGREREKAAARCSKEGETKKREKEILNIERWQQLVGREFGGKNESKHDVGE